MAQLFRILLRLIARMGIARGLRHMTNGGSQYKEGSRKWRQEQRLKGQQPNSTDQQNQGSSSTPSVNIWAILFIIVIAVVGYLYFTGKLVVNI